LSRLAGFVPGRGAAIGLCLLCAGLGACKREVIPSATVTLGGVSPLVNATFVDGVLTLPVGTLVPMDIRVYSYGKAAENNTEYKEQQEGGLPMVADDLNVAIGRHHSADVYVVMGAAVGETVLHLRTFEGRTLESFAVRVVEQP
jgi:hypothetical protein